MYWAGTKLYDFLAGSKLSVPPSSFINKHQASYVFPMLRVEDIYGAIVYYDGQMNDTRFALLVALTAAQAGATTVNHCNVDDLIIAQTEEKRVIRGVTVRDVMTGERINVRLLCCHPLVSQSHSCSSM